MTGSQGMPCCQASWARFVACQLFMFNALSACAMRVLYLQGLSPSMILHTADYSFASSALPGFTQVCSLSWKFVDCFVFIKVVQQKIIVPSVITLANDNDSFGSRRWRTR